MSTMTTSKKSPPAAAATNARHPLALLRQELDDLVSRFWDGDPPGGWFNASFAPSADLIEEANAFEVRMDLPGMEAKDIQIQVEGNVMTVSGTRSDEKEEKGKTYHRVERRSGGFLRSIPLPCQVNSDEVAAQYQQGVLTVKLPKAEKASARKIAIKS